MVLLQVNFGENTIFPKDLQIRLGEIETTFNIALNNKYLDLPDSFYAFLHSHLKKASKHS